MVVIVYFISCGSTCLPGLSNIKSIGNDLWLCINLIINQNNDVIYRFSSASSRPPACLPSYCCCLNFDSVSILAAVEIGYVGHGPPVTGPRPQFMAN